MSTRAQIVSPQATEEPLRDAVVAGGSAALLSGVPSTVHAWWTGGDILEATRAAGAMIIPAESSDLALIAAATLVHCTVSVFWSAILVRVLPRRRMVIWALVALSAIAILDLRIIGPLFPEVYALPFWPQFADHLAFGAVFGAVLDWRIRRRRTSRRVP